MRGIAGSEASLLITIIVVITYCNVTKFDHSSTLKDPDK